MKNKFKLFAMTLGSTSTKIALFENDELLFSANVTHEARKLREFAEIIDQLPFRKETILSEIARRNLSLDGTDAFISAGGGLVPLEGGTYIANDILLEHSRVGFTIKHPNTIGNVLAGEFAREFGGQAFIVNPPDVDELDLVARVCGWSNVSRESRGHPLNQKEVAQCYAKEIGKRYEEINLVVCHAGGGLSIAAHRKGRMVDSSDAVAGDGPMAPTRCGAVPVSAVVKMCFSGKYTEREMHDRIIKNGGLVEHLGTSDAREVAEMIKSGDSYARLIYDAMIYQIGKYIGAYATVLHGQVDGILLTGGITHDAYLVEKVTEMVKYIAPVRVYPGELEMEAMANGALRVLTGQEQAKVYTGIPVWSGFERTSALHAG
jgi:butyrate kinase